MFKNSQKFEYFVPQISAKQKLLIFRHFQGYLEKTEKRIVAMNFIPYKANECLENVYYQIPKELFINPNYKKLSSDNKSLYALLLYRLSISMVNEWIDKDRNILLVFSIKETEEKLNLSDKTITKAFKQLKDVRLIYEKRQGFKKNNIIYVVKINHISNDKIVNRKNYDSRN